MIFAFIILVLKFYLGETSGNNLLFIFYFFEESMIWSLIPIKFWISKYFFIFHIEVS